MNTKLIKYDIVIEENLYDVIERVNNIIKRCSSNYVCKLHGGIIINHIPPCEYIREKTEYIQVITTELL
jgi:hypothetical protein